MIDTMTSQNIYLSSWTPCIYIYKEPSALVQFNLLTREIEKDRDRKNERRRYSVRPIEDDREGLAEGPHFRSVVG